MRKTKIVATIGPASESEEQLSQLASAGMNVARQNFSHGSHDEHGSVLERVHSLDEDVAAMLDTQGPEIRIGEIEEGAQLRSGERVDITAEDVTGDSDLIPVDYEDLFDYLEPGDSVLIDDGEIELEVLEVSDTAECQVAYGGPLYSRKSFNVPGKEIGLKSPTDKDIQDIEFGAEQGFDLIAASFVKSADDIRRIRTILEEKDATDIGIIAKIEHVRAVENIDEIIDVADGIMIARGDLGVEVPASEVPILQKDIIKKCNRAGKPAIVATQMLKSMTESPRATRAEVSDIANAVIDGTDAVMLSEETAIGKYPVKALKFMAEVVEKMEDSLHDQVHHTVKTESRNVADIICKNVWQASRETDVEYLVAHTSSGYTARNIAKYRPYTDIIAFTDSETVNRQLQLVWGVRSFYAEFPDPVDEMICNSAHYLHENDMVDTDDQLVLSAGVPTSVSGTTNMLEIRDVQSLLDERKAIQEKER